MGKRRTSNVAPLEPVIWFVMYYSWKSHYPHMSNDLFHTFIVPFNGLDFVVAAKDCCCASEGTDLNNVLRINNMERDYPRIFDIILVVERSSGADGCCERVAACAKWVR